MAAFIIEGKNSAKLKLVLSLAKELGLSVKEQTSIESETLIETRFKKGFKEAREIQSGKLKGVDAYKFLDGL